MTVKISSFKSSVKKHTKFTLVLSKLVKFGFVIEGFNGKSFDKNTDSFKVLYTKNNLLIPVLKSFAEASRNLIEKETTDKFYIDDVFNCFTHRIVEDKSYQKHEMMFLIATDHFDKESKKTAYRLHEEAKQAELTYPYLYAAFQYQKGKGYSKINSLINQNFS